MRKVLIVPVLSLLTCLVACGEDPPANQPSANLDATDSTQVNDQGASDAGSDTTADTAAADLQVNEDRSNQDVEQFDSAGADSSFEDEHPAFDMSQGGDATGADLGITDLSSLDTSTPDATATGDATDLTLDFGSPFEAFCAGAGSIVNPDDNTTFCEDELAQVSFRFGLCLCEDYSTQASIQVTGIDSEDDDADALGAMATNGSISVEAKIEVDGPLYSYNSGGQGQEA
ncbi:MAG: hypothetical protein KC561_09025, partial [Myxococcales bacterium]|nr:hypothetical protein [Myxococcales bacterium]